MIIESPSEMRIVEDIDFHFLPGGFLGVTIDPKFDDKFVEQEREYVVLLGPRPSIESPNEMLSGEKFVINKDKVAYTASRTRQMRDRSKEETDQWVKTLVQLSGSVN